jgi:hypothetical protein
VQTGTSHTCSGSADVSSGSGSADVSNGSSADVSNGSSADVSNGGSADVSMVVVQMRVVGVRPLPRDWRGYAEGELYHPISVVLLQSNGG